MGKDQELLEAARNGNVPVVEKILGQRAKRSGPLASLRRGPGANVQDTSGYSALHHAALNGHKEIVKLLLEHEASPNIIDGKGCSPLHLAAWTGNVHIVRLLLCHGPSVPNVNLTNKDRETALHCSSQYGHTEVVSLLLEHGCDPTIRNIRQETPLDLAAQYGRLETVETLVRTHPELIAQYSSRLSATGVPLQHTPLHMASRNGHKAVVELLLGSGMEVNVRTASGSALHEAALCGKLEVARTLLQSGIDLNIRDARNNTVSDLLQQFPPHVVQDITSVIRRHKLVMGEASDGEEIALPPIPVVGALGSPYENVRLRSSPNHWLPDRRVSATSALSVTYNHKTITNRTYLSPSLKLKMSSKRRNMFYENKNQETTEIVTQAEDGVQAPKHVPQEQDAGDDGKRGSEDVYESSDGRHYPWGNNCGLSKSVMEASFLSEDSCCSQGRDPDQISISSASSMGGTSSRERRSADIYLPMTPSPGSNNKVSPTPPKKPPRRNLSVSPTHLTPLVSSEGTVGSYEYLFLARSGLRNQTEHQGHLRRGKSADQYVDMKPRYSIAPAEFGSEEQPDYQPIAITSVYENIPFRTTNPKRKLRRLQTEKGYENYDPSIVLSRGDLPFRKVEAGCRPVAAERLRIVDASESQPFLTAPGDGLLDGRRVNGEHESKPVLACPLSPTNYQQPPTPDHPPPSATQAENSIHERIRPLSEEYCNMMKRRSRDMETETEEELLLLVYPCAASTTSTAASTGSLSSATDNNAVEEYVGDVPFAGLFKGSTTGSEKKAERPKTLRRLQNVYETMREGGMGGGGGEETAAKEPDTKPTTMLSPLDEQEEWAKISEIMASFGTGLVRESVFVTELEKEFQARLGLNLTENSSSNDQISSVGQWLQSLGLSQYETTFTNYGYDNLDFMNGVLDDADLKDMGVVHEEERQKILESANALPKKVVEAYLDPVNNNNNNNSRNNNEKADDSENQASDKDWSSVDQWLTRLDLSAYCDTFRRHLYTDMERVRNVWEVELTAVLEMGKPGHRHRILASLPNRGNQPTIQDINADLTQLKSSIQELEGKTGGGSMSVAGGTSGGPGTTGTLRHSHKKSRPAPQPPAPDLQIRDPSQLLVGVPSTLTAQWRHTPHALVTGHLTYLAQYLGSTVVKELRGTESTKKSIQKLKKPQSELKTSPDIYLSISYRGVKFLSADTKELVCEHEIRNIHCACQDAEDLTHFAYITKDHASKSHYCHVFCVQTMDQATEVILTLGQAFEVAYQMALREGQSSVRGGNGHTRSHSANQIMEPTGPGAVTRQPQPTHSRSHSANGQVLLEAAAAAAASSTITNGHPHPPTPPAPPKTPLLLAEEHV